MFPIQRVLIYPLPSFPLFEKQRIIVIVMMFSASDLVRINNAKPKWLKDLELISIIFLASGFCSSRSIVSARATLIKMS
jgi:hypothetical protein